MLKGLHAGLERLLALVPHIDLTRRIFAYQHDRQAGSESMIALQVADCCTHTLSQTLGKCLTVDSLCHDDSCNQAALTRTAQYLTSAILPMGSSAALVSRFAAAS